MLAGAVPLIVRAILVRTESSLLEDVNWNSAISASVSPSVGFGVDPVFAIVTVPALAPLIVKVSPTMPKVPVTSAAFVSTLSELVSSTAFSSPVVAPDAKSTTRVSVTVSPSSTARFSEPNTTSLVLLLKVRPDVSLSSPLYI